MSVVSLIRVLFPKGSLQNVKENLVVTTTSMTDEVAISAYFHVFENNEKWKVFKIFGFNLFQNAWNPTLVFYKDLLETTASKIYTVWSFKNLYDILRPAGV